jgi:LacI family transcriptional regulator
MGYLTDMVAVSMRSGKTNTIAVIIPDIANPFFSTQLKELDGLLRAKGYTSIILNTDEDGEIELEAVKTAIIRKVDGIIICPTQRREDIFKLITDNALPYVIFARRFPLRNFFTVAWDDVQSGYQATEHLLSLGKRRILFLNGPQHISSSVDRFNGYCACLRAYGIPYDPALVVEADILETDHCSCIKPILEARVQFDGIFAFSDFIALAALETLETLGLDLPVVGVDDILSNLNLPIRLTSVGADKKHEAHCILHMLHEQMIATHPIEPYTVKIETHLVVRDMYKK